MVSFSPSDMHNTTSAVCVRS